MARQCHVTEQTQVLLTCSHIQNINHFGKKLSKSNNQTVGQHTCQHFVGTQWSQCTTINGLYSRTIVIRFLQQSYALMTGVTDWQLHKVVGHFCFWIQLIIIHRIKLYCDICIAAITFPIHETGVGIKLFNRVAVAYISTSLTFRANWLP